MTNPYVVTADVPAVSQHAPDFTGAPDANADLDCGEACIRSVAQFIHGFTDDQAAIMLDLEVIRSKVLSYTGSGPATPAMLQKVLTELGIPSTVIQPSSQSQYFYYEWKYLDRGLPLIELRRWEMPTATALHYCVGKTQTESHSTVMDPWQNPATFVTEDYALHWKMAQTAPQWPTTLIGIDAMPA